jgi:hypothetical protein
MSAHSPTKTEATQRWRRVKMHALGLFGANLAIGTLVLWWLPLLFELVRGDANPWPRPLALAPVRSSAGVAVVGDALALAAVVIGIVLVLRAARMIKEVMSK